LQPSPGSPSQERREDVKRAFNADPAKEPLRILLCTDAAREGINLQTRCRDLVHFDLPWNPSRLEQRNGRIDRKMGGAASWALVIDPLARASRVRPH
jgi:SNF2 family DNA or RNA helicase